MKDASFFRRLIIHSSDSGCFVRAHTGELLELPAHHALYAAERLGAAYGLSLWQARRTINQANLRWLRAWRASEAAR